MKTTFASRSRSASHRPGAMKGVRLRGFTMIELIVVIAVIGVLAAVSTSMVAPVMKAYSAQQLRSRLVSEAGVTMRSITREIRSAVPNSLRSANSQCVEFIPTIAGGRFRMQTDTSRAGARWLDASGSTSFDVLSPMPVSPATGDWVVINNLAPSGVYAGTTRTQITSVNTQDALLGTKWLGINSFSPSSSYTNARFAVVSNAVQAVTYFCDGVTGTLNANGTASGRLMRRAAYGFVATAPTSCPVASSSGSQVVLDNVSSCAFLYTMNEPGTEQSGYVGLRLSVTRSGEKVSLSSGAHVDNVP